MTVAWLIGRIDSADVPAVIGRLPSLLPSLSNYSFESPTEPLDGNAPPADLVLVVQHRPAEISRREAETLIGSQPLARIVVGLGPWCESHQRSERTWPEAVSVPFYGLAARLRQEAEVIRGRASRVPVTASRDELFLGIAAEDPIPPVKFSTLSPDPAFREMLAELAESAGAQPCNLEKAAVVLCDVDPLTAERLERISALRTDQPARRIVALTALPTARDVAALMRAGADAVLPKPFAAGDLFASLRE